MELVYTPYALTYAKKSSTFSALSPLSSLLAYSLPAFLETPDNVIISLWQITSIPFRSDPNSVFIYFQETSFAVYTTLLCGLRIPKPINVSHRFLL